jgi:hypothetical protein
MSSKPSLQQIVSEVMRAGYHIWNEPARVSHYVRGKGEMPLIIKVKKPGGELITSDKEYNSQEATSEAMHRIYHHFYQLIK